jgi:hypothetical protein
VERWGEFGNQGFDVTHLMQNCQHRSAPFLMVLARQHFVVYDLVPQGIAVLKIGRASCRERVFQPV